MPCLLHALALECMYPVLLLAQQSSLPTVLRRLARLVLNLGLLAGHHLGNRTQTAAHELPSLPALEALHRQPCHTCS
ncbi:Uncharacterised protein [Vibrio cholerae]|uniref:Uncharacterized protein n=1 Tax=Vibrio cholerae TaxID=666 RepID=A0A656A6M5_VIBCL|nr:hypothetical protein DN43_3556 [Vibrio cholerae]KFE10971.1 hypothetical protein DN37_3535 [Vibrio cholerae]KFE14455.1 hypothetical protein DN38_3638 [Vibrio cholerae]CRZ54943.1 Uncharacterised protein [Vibrio cholerae]CSC94887.1 Uncharacterised protein [Vibrio cholerae]